MFEAAMLGPVFPVVRRAARWVPFALLILTIVVPSILQLAWLLVENTGTALSSHAEQLTYELNWRLMNGSI